FDAGALLLEPLAARFAKIRPDAELRTPLGGSLDGALTLARVLLRAPSAFPQQDPYVTVRLNAPEPRTYARRLPSGPGQP
uniref:hypothetical protein n=1 Tax=Arthrobacter sp. TB 26 TaxID=494420 RepID=UPI000552565C